MRTIENFKTFAGTGISALILISLALALLSTAGIVKATPTEVHVYEGDSIQKAIDKANAGDTIIVHKGTYDGFDLDKNDHDKTVKSAVLHKAIIKGDVDVRKTHNTTVKGFKILPRKPVRWKEGVEVWRSDNVEILANHIEDWGIGVLAEDSDLSLNQNNLVNNLNTGVLVFGQKLIGPPPRIPVRYDLTNNWWGDKGGPGVKGTNTICVFGKDLTDVTAWSPWLDAPHPEGKPISVGTQEERITVLEEEVSSKEEAIDALKEHLSAKKEKISGLEAKLSNQRDKLARKEAKIDELEEKLSRKTAKIDELEKEIAEQKTEISHLRGRLDSAEATCLQKAVEARKTSRNLRQLKQAVVSVLVIVAVGFSAIALAQSIRK